MVAASHKKRPTDRIICAYYYHYPVDKLLKNIKYKQRLVTLEALAAQLINKIISLNATNIDLLVPVPMSKYRLMLRGMNQATQICKVISKQLNIPCDYTSLQRTKHTLTYAQPGHQGKKTKCTKCILLGRGKSPRINSDY